MRVRKAPNRIEEAALTSEHRLALRDLNRAMTSLLGGNLVHLELFGSRARGDAGADSDLDVVLVADELSQPLMLRTGQKTANIRREPIPQHSA
jgi:predicted nucleotidyltransferase